MVNEGDDKTQGSEKMGGLDELKRPAIEPAVDGIERPIGHSRQETLDGGDPTEATQQRRFIRWRSPSQWSEGLKNAGIAKLVILILVVLIVASFAFVPILYLFRVTFLEATGTWSLEAFRDAYTQIGLGALALNSIQFAVMSSIISMVVGTSLAYIAARTDAPFKGLIFAASVMPLVIPGILHTIAWIFLASPRTGLFNIMLEPIFGPESVNVFSMTGMSIVQGVHLSPLVFLMMYSAFRSMDPSLEESALMSGARWPAVFRRVSIPLVRPALYASLLIMLVHGLEAFEVPALLGIPQGIWVFTSRIWRVLNEFPVNYGAAGAYSLTLLAITAAGVYWQSRLSMRTRDFQTITGKGFRPHPMPLGKFRWVVAGGVLSYFAIAVVMPVFVLVFASTQSFYAPPSMASIDAFSLDNYRYAFSDPMALRALRNSLFLGFSSATAVMLVMAVAAWIVVRTRIPGRWTIDLAAFMPLTIPGLVMGVALLFVYLRSPLPVFGTLWLLFIAYFTRYMPYGMRYASSSMYQIGTELEESAQVSGATWWQVFRKINAPLLASGLLAGWVFIFMISIRELSSSILLYSPGGEVLSVVIWELWENGQLTQLSALGVIMIAGMLAIVILARKFGLRIGVQG